MWYSILYTDSISPENRMRERGGERGEGRGERGEGYLFQRGK
jgi:hypothetical protein